MVHPALRLTAGDAGRLAARYTSAEWDADVAAVPRGSCLGDLRGPVLWRLAAFLTLRDIVQLGTVCQLLYHRTQDSNLWEYLLEARFAGLAPNDDVPPSPPAPTGSDSPPRLRFLTRTLSQLVSTAGRDVCIAGLPAPTDAEQEPWWTVDAREDSDFGRCAVLQCICWGEWFAWRNLPAEAYDVVVRMQWSTEDFDRVERPTEYYVHLLPAGTENLRTLRQSGYSSVKDFVEAQGVPEAGGALLLKYTVTDTDRDRLRATVDQWVYLNLGPIFVPRPGLVVVRYWGCCPYWFAGWAVDWVGFLPPQLIPPGVSLAGGV